MTQTPTAPRVSYPLAPDDIKELEDLESKLKQMAETAEKEQKVALHNCYHQILKFSSTAIARAKLRSTREENAERTRRHKSLKKIVASKVTNGAPAGVAGANGTP
jgi:hypothetical protein